ncbi:MAG TPA: universal stress protein [Solirubrobacteraceae bacterium]|jgi:hypothetical protein
MKSPWRNDEATARHDGARRQPADAPRILFPFIASALSSSALDAALRLARVEGAVLVPVFLAQVPRWLPLDCPLPRQAGAAVATQEAVEQRAASFGVPVDARLERGRTARHALMRAIECERYDRIVVAAAAPGAHGFEPDDVAWLLAHAPGEIVVLRPGREDDLLELEPEQQPETRGPTVAMPAAFS